MDGWAPRRQQPPSHRAHSCSTSGDAQRDFITAAPIASPPDAFLGGEQKFQRQRRQHLERLCPSAEAARDDPVFLFFGVVFDPSPAATLIEPEAIAEGSHWGAVLFARRQIASCESGEIILRSPRPRCDPGHVCRRRVLHNSDFFTPAHSAP